MAMTPGEAAPVLADPAAYADPALFDEACAVLRASAPVQWVSTEDVNPFWAITRHADIKEIERQHETFHNAPRSVLARKELDAIEAERGQVIRTLVHMDDPDHRKYRAIGADWFSPRAMRQLQVRVDELAKHYVDTMVERGPECDFVTDIAVRYPLYVILSLLGLPESDFPRMLTLTQELFGGADPERQRGQTEQEQLAVLSDFFGYFQQLTAARRAEPTEDLASAIANARVDGEQLNDLDTASYYTIIATAGHDTTSASIAGGLLALIEHPAQLERLRRDRQLLPLAVEEIIRWVTPVKAFLRNATEDYELHGTRIAAGDSLLLCYPSGNRDERVFEHADEFDVGRTPNRHLAFGTGVHYCLGAALARMEVTALLGELVPRLDWIELAGRPEFIATTFVGGLKHLPIRYRMR